MTLAAGLMVIHFNSAASADNPPNFRRLTPKDGLPSEQVFCIMQDSRGFLWFGTADGLARYDSHEFQVFRPDPNDIQSLSATTVFAIQEDSHGSLWVATSAGLDIWNRDTERFSHILPNSMHSGDPASHGARSLLQNRDGTLWVGTSGAGLALYNPESKEWRRWKATTGAADGLGGNYIQCLFHDSQDCVWIGTADGGLSRFDSKTGHVHTYRHDPADPRSICDDRISAIAEDAEGFLWLGTQNGVSRLDKERRFFERFPADANDPGALQARIVDAVLADRDGRVWVGTDGGGLSRFDFATRKFVHYRHSKFASQSLASNAVRALYEDRSGDLWVGHYPDGVSHANRLAAVFQSVQSQPGETNSLSDDDIQSLIEDDSGGLWVGTDNGGLSHWDAVSGRWTSYQHKPQDATSLAAKAAISLLLDSSKRLWVGTWDGGLNRLLPETGTFRRYMPESGRSQSISSRNISFLLEDRNKQIWAATWGGGIARYSPADDGFTIYRNEPRNPRSLNNDYVRCLLETRDGSLWAGTDSGLARRAPAGDGWDRFQAQNGLVGALTSNKIADMIEDRNGLIWLTTEGGGLNRLDPRTGFFSDIRTADGLPSDVLRGILEDSDGILWIGSNKGLIRLDPLTYAIRVFDTSCGLPDDRFYPHARVQLRTGELVFGTKLGLVKFDPRAVQLNTNPPPVKITGFELFNKRMAAGDPGSPLEKSIAETRRLVIRPGMSVLSFQFAALNYRSSERNHYWYRLDNFDSNWRRTGDERRATYTNLDPGKYQLMVRAANNDNIFSQAELVLDLEVLPPWWRLWWTRTLVLAAGLVLAGKAGWTISHRQARERLREAAREREAAKERERADAALRESAGLRKRVFDSSHIAMVILDAVAGCCVDCNPAAVELLGFSSRERLIGKSPEDVSAPEQYDGTPSAEKALQYIREALQEGMVTFEWRHRRPDGTVWDAEVHLLSFQSGDKLFLQLTLQDITSQKRSEEEKTRLQEQLNQARKMESVGRLAGGVAHDFNNMLQVIVGNADLALELLPTGSEARSCLEEIQKSGQRSADLTRQLLAFARKQTIDPRVLDLNETIAGMLKLLRRLIGENIELAWQPGAGVWPVKMDRSQIDQILANLCANARDAIGGTGKVTIQTGNMTLDSAYAEQHAECLPGDYVMIAVSDTGCGMDATTRAHLFEPFFTTKEVGKGTGLGLATVFGIVKQNHGLINVYSEPGCGSAFKIFLPRAQSDSVEETQKPQRRSVLGCETVLVVEDEEQILNLACRILRQNGYSVLPANAPGEALTLADSFAGDIHLLVTDVVMPGMNGRDLLRRLMEKRPRIQCLFMSGYTADLIAHHGVLDEGVHFLQKPFTVQSLGERVRDVLDR